MGTDAGDVGDPYLIGGRHIEVLIQLVSSNNRWFAAMLTGTALVAYLRTQSFSLHQSGDRVLGAVFAKTEKIMMDFAGAIHAPAL